MGLEHGAFETLRKFESAIHKCVVTLPDQTTVGLTDGLGMAVRMLKEICRMNRKVILIGNGGSAAVASHQAVDLWKHAGIKALTFNDAALLTCAANDFGFENVFARPLKMFGEKGDLLIAISSSGNSTNILNAVETALANSMRVIGFSGFKPTNALNGKADLNFFIPSPSYGVVEVAHLLLLHAIIDETVATLESR